MSDEARAITVWCRATTRCTSSTFKALRRSSRARANPGTGCWSFTAGDKVLGRFPFRTICGWYDGSAIE